MPRDLQGLRGLKGLGSLSKAQYDDFINKNRELISQHGFDPTYINNLYSNKQFIDKYGVDNFKAIPDIDMRNKIYKDDIVNTEFNNLYKNAKGFDFNKYSQLSTDAKLKLMESGYLTPSEFEDSWQKHMKESAIERSGTGNSPSKTLAMPAGIGLMRSINSMVNAISKGRGMSEAIGLFTPGGEEAAKKVELDKNQRILDNIYSEDADTAADKFAPQVSQAYQELAGMSDSQVFKSFMQAITPSQDRNGGFNFGVPEYAKYFGNGSESERKAPMQDFSIDDMRQVLAKKKVYDANMSPEMAMQALNNDAKRYATENQGLFRRLGLFAKDVGISTLSYTADKVNGLYNLGLFAADKLGDKPVVWVDDRGNVLDPNKTKFVKDRRGNTVYQDGEGNMHYAHRQQIDRTTLHNMGRNSDGSEDTGILSPTYWTRAEQFGTLDSDEQKQYEKLGTSPYKVAYNPNEDSDLWYESFKMMSFGIADAGSQLLPYGVGLFGRTLSAASKAGKVAQGLGKVLDTTGKMLSFELKAGQIAQGTSGALGIAYAYNRGAFQETLQQNLANAEEAALNASKQDIYNQYNSDKNYKAGVDKLINARAASMKADYIAQMQRDGGMRIADEKAIDRMLHARAQDAVLGELVQQRLGERKSSKEYADLQQKAIDGAGDAAMNTFLTEGLKYGFVNTLGYRKFLYTNPAGLSKKLSTSLKGLKEVTTEGGKKRLATEASKFLTRKDKLKEFGKTLGSQAWGGAWTNGTDDMQVDAAERINEDSFNKYLDAYQSGKAMANTYGFADGLYSYVKGLQNSLGQETTWNSAAVGGLGSLISATPNFANIARLATKEGREAWRNNFNREIERDKDGIPLRNEDGSVKYKDLGWKDNWRERANYFIQNGVLNTYYGKKQSERDLQNHADFVNNILDEYRDFEDIEHLVASNMAGENYANDGDVKTLQFLKALQAVNALNNLGNNSSDPATMSSVVQNAKTLIDRAARFTDESNDSSLNEEQISNLLSQYYASNPGLEQNEENNLKALEVISKNAKTLQKASEAFDKANGEIAKIERNLGYEIDPRVKMDLAMQHALGEHWQERKQQMQSEIGDSSSDDAPMDANTYIASVGGRKNAQSLVKVYNRQQQDLENELAEQREKTAKLQEELDKATKQYKEAYAHGEWFTTDNATLEAEKRMENARAEVDNAKMQEDFISGMLSRTVNKRKSLEMDIEGMSLDDTTRRVALAQEELAKYQEKLKTLREQRKKYVNKNGERDKRYSPEKLAEIDKSIEDCEKNVTSRKEILERNKEKMLTADEIFSLDPVSRARMMSKENRDLYSDEQKREIEKLEQKLVTKDADALQKIQDIALLTQRISTSQDAYARMASNPLAAAKAFDEQRLASAQEAAGILDHNFAENIADVMRNTAQELQKNVHSDSDKEVADNLIYNSLRRLNYRTLDIMDMDDMLPEYKTQLDKAKEWSKVTNDIDAIISTSGKNADGQKSLRDNIDSILSKVDSKDDIIPTLEKVVDDTDGTEVSKDVEYILNELEKLNYQRDATILENRKKKREREEEERKKKEEEQKKVDEESKGAADSKVESQEDEDLGKVPSSNDSVETEDIPWDDIENDNTKTAKGDSKSQATEAPQETSTPEESNTQTVDEEDGHQIDNGVMNGKTMMQDNFGNGSISFGEMDYDLDKNPRKGNFLASRDEDGITFWIDDTKASNYKDTLAIEPSEYEIVTDEQEDKKNLPFTAISMRKIDGDWYFNGIFAGDNNNTQVKVRKDFDLDKAIERQQAERKSELIAKGEDVHDPSILDNGDSVQGQSLSIEQQAEESSPEGKEVHVSDVNEDVDNLNSMGEQKIETSPTTLGGNAMSEYNPSILAEKGRLVHKKGAEEHDHMNQYYAWMNAAGIKMQNIIDHELARIIQRNPHAKVKFLAVTPAVNTTHDNHLKNDLFLVLDYDNSINKGITSIHDDANGGVIESHGKKYLMIGTASYGDRNLAKQAMYNILFGKTENQGIGLMVSGRVKYFKEHPDERFYVNDELTTEVVPYSQIPGYIVRQAEGDEGVEHRSVKDLLADERRNPMHYDFKDLAWGIQELTQFMVVGTTIDNVMVPRNVISNSGSAFVLMPASNGKLVPSYLKPLKYNEMNDGRLKDKVNDLLQSVVAPNYKTRYDAVMGLSNIFHFDKDHDFILLSKNKPVVSLTHEGKVFKTFVLNSDFDRGEFMRAMEEMNPRVNVTARVLQSEELLNDYNEAGALMTDAAMFGTAGSSYSIYALDRDGKMIMPETPVNSKPKAADNSDFRNTDRSQVVYRMNYYTYQESDGNFYLDGKLVTDEKEIKQLQYNKRILDSEMSPATTKGVLDYYILSTGEHPEVINIDRNTKEVKKVPEEQAKELIKKLEEEKNKKDREAKALKSVEDIGLEGKVMEGTLPEIVDELRDKDETSTDEGGDYVDPETGEVTPRNNISNQYYDLPNEVQDRAEKEIKDFIIDSTIQFYKEEMPYPLNEAQVNTMKRLTLGQLYNEGASSQYLILDANRSLVAKKWEELMGKYVQQHSTKEDRVEEPLVPTNQGNANVENTTSTEYRNNTQSFATLYKNAKYTRKLNTLFRKKWKDAPARINELEKFLRDRNIEVDAIGTSKEDIDAWIKTMEDCR